MPSSPTPGIHNCHLRERGPLKAQNLITMFLSSFHFERASSQSDKCEGRAINLLEEEGPRNPGAQAKAATEGLARVSASAGAVGTAGLPPGWCSPGVAELRPQRFLKVCVEPVGLLGAEDWGGCGDVGSDLGCWRWA